MATQAIDILIKARDEASKKFGAVGNAANGMASILKTAAIGIAGYFSARAIIGFAQSSVQAFMVQQNAVMGLESALDLLGKKTESVDLQNFASEIQRVTTIGDEATLAVMKLGASMGNLSGDALKKATLAAIGLSKAYNMDLNTAMTLIAKAAQGNTAAMSRYGIVFEEGMTAQEKFNRVLDIGVGKFSMATAETQTFAGKVQQLSNAWGDAKEKLGQYIVSTPMLSSAIDFAKTVIENFGLSIDIVTQSAALGFVSLWEDIKYGFGTVVPAYLDWFLENWKNIFETAWNLYKSVLSNMWENWKNFFSALYSWIKGDGFDFQWTGLLEGFKSTIGEMKPIAEREMSDLEKALALELSNNLDKFKQAGQKPVFNPADITGGAVASATKAAEYKGGRLSAVEARFLTGAGGMQINYEKQNLTSAQKRERHLEKMVRLLEQYVKPKQSMQQPTVLSVSNAP